VAEVIEEVVAAHAVENDRLFELMDEFERRDDAYIDAVFTETLRIRPVILDGSARSEAFMFGSCRQNGVRRDG